MEHEHLEAIMRRWLPEAESIEFQRIQKGTSSKAYHVTYGSVQGVLREIASVSQAETEAVLAAVLAPKKLTPHILMTVNQSVYVLDQNRVYNFQEYLKVDSFQPQGTELACQLAITIARMQKILAQSNLTLPNRPDRFSADLLWKSAKAQIALFPAKISAEHDALIQHLVQKWEKLKMVNDQPIHGDLGLWNTLWTSSGMRIIDFGEARMGDPYLDLAGAVSSLLQSEKNKALHPAMIETFLCSYTGEYQEINRTKLHDWIQFWLLRGMLAIITYQSPEIWNKQFADSWALIQELNILLSVSD